MLNSKVTNGLIEKGHLINGDQFFFMPIKVFLYENRTININSLPSMYHINGHYTEGYILKPINKIWEIMTINYFNALLKIGPLKS